MADIQWFCDARFGMFIHWGLYAVPAKGEWYASIGRVPPERYEEYLRTFDPVDYDPRAWARLARQAGMKYAVLTAKHHEGFCLFDSAYTDYKATNTPAGRDLVREYVDAFRAEGLRVGLYYSLVDWHHPDYPAYNDPFHPMRGTDVRREERCDFSRYLDYMHAQVRELCTNYGKLDLLWFDFPTTDTVARTGVPENLWRWCARCSPASCSTAGWRRAAARWEACSPVRPRPGRETSPPPSRSCRPRPCAARTGRRSAGRRVRP